MTLYRMSLFLDAVHFVKGMKRYGRTSTTHVRSRGVCSVRSRQTGDSRLPVEEIDQPDPMLALSTGKMGAGGIALVALAIAVILGIVFYAMMQ